MSKRFAVLALASLIGLVVTAWSAAAEEPTTTDLSKGLAFRSGDNSLTLGAYVQVRAIVDDKEAFDADTTGSGVGKEDGVSPSFDVFRVRVYLKGGFYEPWLKYNLSYELARTSGERDSKVKDAFLEIAAQPMATVRFGQYKVPFSLQELTGDANQQFVDRAITNSFAPSRDTGISLNGLTQAKSFGYSAGVFNGSGESKVQEDKRLMYAARFWFDPLGEYKLAESSVEGPEKNLLHFGLGYRGGEAMKVGTTGIFEGPDDQRAANLELAWKFRRWFATGEYFDQKNKRRNPSVLPDVDSRGWHIQGGFIVLASRLEIGLRWAALDPNNDADDDKLTEFRGAINYYWKAHGLKLQADLGSLKYEPGAPGRSGLCTTTTAPCRLSSATGQDVTDTQARLQLQLSF